MGLSRYTNPKTIRRVISAGATGGLSEAALFAKKKMDEGKGGGGGGDPEQRLRKMQIDALAQQKREEALFRPEYYRTMGFKLDPETNKYVKMTEEERLASMTPEERSSYDIQTLANERSLKALRGELEIDPAVEQDIASEEERTRQELANQLGSGYAVSTPGMKRLAELSAKANALRAQLRRGEMSTAEAISSNRAGQRAEYADTYRTSSSPMNRISATSNMLDYYAEQRARHDELRQRRKEMYGDIAGSIIGAGGSIGAASILSDRRLKKNIKRIGVTSKGYPLYTFEYLWGEHSAGVMADEVPHARILGPQGYWMVDYSKVV